MRIDWRGMLRTTLLHRCPACGQGALFRRGYTLRERCGVCGLGLLGWHGAQYGGPIILGYAVGGLAGLATFALLGWRFGFEPWGVWVAVAAVVVAVLATFRHCKAFWTWFLYATDELDRGPGG